MGGLEGILRTRVTKHLARNSLRCPCGLNGPSVNLKSTSAWKTNYWSTGLLKVEKLRRPQLVRSCRDGDDPEVELQFASRQLLAAVAVARARRMTGARAGENAIEAEAVVAARFSSQVHLQSRQQRRRQRRDQSRKRDRPLVSSNHHQHRHRQHPGQQLQVQQPNSSSVQQLKNRHR